MASTSSLPEQKLLPCSFSPSLHTERSTNEYRFQFPGEGLFQCSATGLVFVTTGEGDIAYTTMNWNERWLQSSKKSPAGPLFDLQYPQESVCQLHLPHCDITPGDDLCVANITDEGSVLLKPLKVTKTHVIVNVKGPSRFGIVRKLSRKLNPTHAQIQLFLRLPSLEIKVFLLPGNLPLDEVRAQHKGNRHLEATSACELVPDHHYSLHCPPHEVQPTVGTYSLNYGPNYHHIYEVDVDGTIEAVSLELRGPEEEPVWQQRINLKSRLDDSGPGQLNAPPAKATATTSPEAALLLSARMRFIKQVPGVVILRLLDTLLDEEIIDDPEMDLVTVEKERSDRARVLIDMARRKGSAATLRFISSLLEEDPALHRELGFDQP